MVGSISIELRSDCGESCDGGLSAEKTSLAIFAVYFFCRDLMRPDPGETRSDGTRVTRRISEIPWVKPGFPESTRVDPSCPVPGRRGGDKSLKIFTYASLKNSGNLLLLSVILSPWMKKYWNLTFWNAPETQILDANEMCTWKEISILTYLHLAPAPRGKSLKKNLKKILKIPKNLKNPKNPKKS